MVRAIAAVLDLSWVQAELAPHYSPFGRPSIDPVLMIRMLIVGYVFAIRSERALSRGSAQPRVSLGLWAQPRGQVFRIIPRFAPVMSVSVTATSYGVFERVVGACIAAGLVGGKGFAVDASLIQADANKHRSIPGAEWSKDIDPEQARRAVKEYLATLDDPAFGQRATSRRSSSRRPTCRSKWTGALRNAAFFAYADNYLIDVKFGIIMDVEASRAIRQAEVGASQTMIERTEACFGIKPEWLVADTAYGSAANLDWLVNKKGSRRMFRLSTSRSATMGRSIGKTSRSTRSVTFTSVRRVSFSPRQAGWSTMGRQLCFYSRACSTVVAASSRRDAVQRHLFAGSRAASTRKRVTLPVHWQRLRRSSNRAAIARKSRCCSLT